MKKSTSDEVDFLIPAECGLGLIGHHARVPGRIEGEFYFHFVHLGYFHEVIFDIFFDDRKERAAHGSECHLDMGDAFFRKGRFINQPEIDERYAEFGIEHFAKLIFYDSFDFF